jgi:hypothetical protein
MRENDALDEWLREAPLELPAGFAAEVMAQVQQLALPVGLIAPTPKGRWREWVQWLVLLASVAAGSLQLAGFVFGIWTAAGAA